MMSNSMPAAGTITVTLANTILFDSGKATLKSATSKELDHILGVLKDKYSGKTVDVVGHTDTEPIKKSSWKDNWELSAQRALVRDKIPDRSRHPRQAGPGLRLRFSPAGCVELHSRRQGQEPPRRNRRLSAQRSVATASNS